MSYCRRKGVGMTAALEISIEVFTRYSSMNSMFEKENARTNSVLKKEQHVLDKRTITIKGTYNVDTYKGNEDII